MKEKVISAEKTAKLLNFKYINGNAGTNQNKYDWEEDLFYSIPKNLTQKEIVCMVNEMTKQQSNEKRPRRLAGWMKGKIHYDESADIFNLGPL